MGVAKLVAVAGEPRAWTDAEGSMALAAMAELMGRWWKGLTVKWMVAVPVEVVGH